eukprot:TRINITY_DN2422_c0_g2_i3.p2 TRINITY_DN2422_c0_g2~~TRINITY_DN2422_c0_g2_i3.p2  ORF type:complete len:257 (+),score=-9.23 TRINITY_DN2422_c0_g2_i3:217-987(+)
MTSASTTFTTTHRMVNRVHRHTTYVRTFARITFSTGLTQFNVHQFPVTHGTDCSTALKMYHPYLTARQLDLGITVVFTTQNSALTSGSYQFSPATGTQFDVVDRHTYRNVFDLESVTRLKFSLGAAHDHIANLETSWSDDVRFHTVSIADQRNIRGTIRIVLNALHCCRNVILGSFEVDHTVTALVAAPTKTRSNTPRVITVSYTHLTLPTKRIVQISVVAGSLQKKHPQEEDTGTEDREKYTCPSPRQADARAEP